jgi:hypothetical protein
VIGYALVVVLLYIHVLIEWIQRPKGVKVDSRKVLVLAEKIPCGHNALSHVLEQQMPSIGVFS